MGGGGVVASSETWELDVDDDAIEEECPLDKDALLLSLLPSSTAAVAAVVVVVIGEGPCRLNVKLEMSEVVRGTG